MSTTTSTNSAADLFAGINALGQTAATKAGSTSAQDIQGRFLTLLVTQLRNQDPLNPMDNGQVTTQLSQISTVSGIEKLNATVSQMLDVYNNGQTLQAAGMIGKSVMAAGSQLMLQGSQAVGGVSLTTAADQVSVSVIDAAGNVVQTEDLGARSAGIFGFVWDGVSASGTTMPDGKYSFRVTATQGGKNISAESLQVGTVFAVTRAASGFQLDLGGAGTVDFSSVRQIL